MAQDLPVHQLVQLAAKMGGPTNFDALIRPLMPARADVAYLTPKRVRVFVSSTFRDMHFERATLARSVSIYLSLYLSMYLSLPIYISIYLPM